MFRRILMLVFIAALLTFGVAGCKKATSEQAAPAKTAEEYKQEADKEITEENMDAELQKIEKDLNAEEQ